MLEWYGDRVAAKVVRAASGAMATVVDGAVDEARANTPVDTGAAQASLGREEQAGLEAKWGYHVPYGIWIEIGSRGRAGVYALRRAADHHYPRLTGEMRRRFGGV